MRLKTVSALIAGIAFSLTARCQLRLATYQYASNDRIENMKPLAARMSDRFKCEVEVVSYPGVNELIKAIKKGEVDIALISTFGFLRLQEGRSAHPMIPLVTWHTNPADTGHYRCVFIASRVSQVSTLRQIAEQAGSIRLLLVSNSSTSGNLIPRIFLNGWGIPLPEAQFKKVHYAGTHLAVAEGVARGEADLGALGSNAFFEFVRDQPDALQQLWISPEIPLGPVLLRKNLSRKLKSEIARLLTNLHIDDPDAFIALREGWSEAAQALSLVPIKPDHYATRFGEAGQHKALEDILHEYSVENR